MLAKITADTVGRIAVDKTDTYQPAIVTIQKCATTMSIGTALCGAGLRRRAAHSKVAESGAYYLHIVVEERIRKIADGED